MARALNLAEVEHISILGSESIVCGFHLVDYIWTDIFSNLPPASTYVLITDSNLAKLYLSQYQESFQAAWAHHHQSKGGAAAAAAASPPPPPPPPRLLTHVLAPGELSKSRATKSAIEDWMFGEKCTRDTLVLALGGGVIGDLVGFVAATFMRGVGFVQIPTSLLAMVDSSIGGKTAVDTPAGKNLVGAFWQPKRIYMDMAVLRTLPAREFSNGMAEVIKTAAIWDSSEFEVLEGSSEEIRRAVLDTTQAGGLTLATRSASQQLLQRVIAASARVKAYVVTHDERESGMRGLLNFGHTIGHAIEAVLSPQVLHGECVAVGSVLEAEVARRMGHLSEVGVARLVRCLRAYGLPTAMDDPLIRGLCSSAQLAELRPQRLMDIMGVDKKTVGTQKRMVVLRQLGATLEMQPTRVADSLIVEVLSPGVLVQPVGDSGPDAVVVTPPGSKSISNRALQLAALGVGTCRLRNLLHSDDTQVMLAALQAMGGCSFAWEDGGDTLVVTGGGGALHGPASELYLGNAGTAARFLTTTANLIGAGDRPTVLTGNARMKQRPCGPLVDALRANGCAIDYCEKQGSLPLRVTHSGAGFPGGRIELAASVSSQYVSSILLCAPYAREPVQLALVGGKVISQAYIDMTVAMMAQFGCHVRRISDTEYVVPVGAYQNPAEYVVESDASSATYPLAFAAITGRQCTVPNIGSASLQGDARFAVDVLRPMGCDVTQTATSTTVRGPARGSLLALGDIDMEPMTDAFLTAAVLAAVAPGNGGVTRIRGIANQHVKECDRIQAMCDELRKFGVEATNHADGIDVHACQLDRLLAGTPSVHCYDDHRVAMSFSVLGCAAGGGAEIGERRCVAKTWPQWWDVLARDLGVSIAGADPKKEEKSEEKDEKGVRSVVFIGMRGAGKSTLGRAAASALGLAFVDMDAYLEQKVGKAIPEVIAQEDGWAVFRTHESRLLAQALGSDHPSGAVIACGGGVVEAPENRALLQRHMAQGGAVVCLTPNIDHVAEFLGQDTSRPAYAAGDVRDVYARRQPLYAECSNYEMLVDTRLPGGWAQAERECVRLVALASGVDCNRVDLTRQSFFVSLTAPDVAEYLESGLLDAVTAGAHAVELRADLLSAISADDAAAAVQRQFAMLRHATPLPVVFTVRTVAQGGAFRGSDALRMQLLHAAVRWGAEYVDVEVDDHAPALYAARRNSLVIASFHDPTGQRLRWDACEFSDDMLRRARACGDIAKLISYANAWSDNVACAAFVRRHHEPANPLIALNMGYTGQMSRVTCPVLTPVTHPALSTAAAPGQLSVQQINAARSTAGLLPARRLALCGSPIQHSPSPAMHNAAFAALGLPHVYGLHETEHCDTDLKDLFASPNFGGASVTIPLKQSVIPLLDRLTPAARRIGAVNTVIPIPGGLLLGDNTDYLGIVGCLRRAHPGALSSALVVGAGGTARAALYALHTLRVRSVAIYNRTPQRAQDLVAEFAELFDKLVSVADLADAHGLDCVIGTVPACDLAFPDSLFASAKEGVALDMAYKPRWTPLLEAADRHKWRGVPGVDVLIEQGIHQMEKWSHSTAPRQIMADAVYTK
ncbi:hypothetical protein GGI20_002766 [Coemansia sp. BCRC 34301]|nr:hypothetical protein GGI20_002766 [Coemansia sp. BCRC 34301]